MLDKLLSAIDEAMPVPGRFVKGLPYDVRELSELFTSRRSERGLSYLGRPGLTSAYLRYFLPWNVFRLSRLLPSMPFDLENGSTVLDIGSGPLTFVLALWISRPDLRDTALEFTVIDKTPKILEAGKKIFNALVKQESAGNIKSVTPNWTIKTLRGGISRTGFLIDRNKKRTFLTPEKLIQGKNTTLVTAINVFNEIYWEISPADIEGQRELVGQTAAVLAACAKNGSILVAEPGIPRSGAFISGLRSTLLEHNFNCVSPCLHNEACPFPGSALNSKKTKWCHFSFDTDSAPAGLLDLSEAAGIPKERAVVSYLFLKDNGRGSLNGKAPFRNHVEQKNNPHYKTPARILSDAFPVGSQFGRYACSIRGAVLVTGARRKIEALDSGSEVNVRITGQKDQKSGALTGEI